MRRRPRYAAAIAASLIAEAVFMAMVAAVSALRGMDPWRVTRMPASFLLGPAAVEPPGWIPGDVATGLAMHVAFAVVVGAAYGALLPRLGLAPIPGGLIAGAVLYLLGFWMLPLLFPGWLSPFWLPPEGKLLQAMAHAVYGVAFGVAFRRLTAGDPARAG